MKKYNIEIVLTGEQLRATPNADDYLAKLLRINPGYHVIKNDDGSVKHIQKISINQQFIKHEPFKERTTGHSGINRNFY
jgi:hypothetical protein